ncbi:hypothetical protein ACWDTD_01075 [Gordonia sp. NPDC003425]
MNRGPATLHRITAGIFGIAVLLVGVGAVLWQLHVPVVREWADHLDAGWASRLARTDWWIVVLFGVAIVGLVWSWSLLATAIRPNKVDELELSGSNADGRLTVAPKLIAAAVADDLAGNTMFDEVTAKALDDRGRKIIRITVTAPPTYSYDEIAAVLGPEVQRVRTAVDGSDVHVQALVHLHTVS